MLLKGIKPLIPPLPLQDVAGVNTTPTAAVVTAGKTHVRAGAPAAYCSTLPVTTVVPLGWGGKKTTYDHKERSVPQ